MSAAMSRRRTRRHSEPLVDGSVADLGLDLVELLVRGQWQRGASIPGVERLGEISAPVHVAAAFDQLRTLEALLEKVRGIGDGEALAIGQHVLGTELSWLLTGLLARRGVQIRSDVLVADVAPERTQSLATGGVTIEHR